MNITKGDVLELRRRLKKTECTFGNLCGCYVNSGKQVVVKFREPFSELGEDEFYKYLEIAKKTLSGTLGSNLLELEFDRSEAAAESAAKGHAPLSACQRTTASEKTSLRSSTSMPSICSGGM